MRRRASERVGEVAAVVRLGPRLTPASISHAGRPELSWIVWYTLDSWRISPAGWFRARGTPAVLERHRVLVAGPVPGEPGEFADYVLVVSRYGDQPCRWWMRPEYIGTRLRHGTGG
jgi:hypothetical protein